MSNRSSTTYRFALVGVSGSGKTCYLAAMAMGAQGHGNGLTCVRVQRRDQGQSTSKDLQSIDRGSPSRKPSEDRFEEAVQALRNRQRPAPTRMDDLADDQLPDIEFAITTPKRGEIRVRTKDYAGELLTPDGLKKDDKSVRQLLGFLAKQDGIIILVAPIALDRDKAQREKVEAEDQFKNKTDRERLLDLREFFVAIQDSEKNRSVPIAVVVTQWDSVSEINFNTPSDELAKLKNKLDEPSYEPVTDLLATVQNVQTNQEPLHESEAHGLFYGNCAVFATSAFGRNQDLDESNIQKSAIGGTEEKVFGLLEPFVWLAERRDLLDAKDWEKRWKEVNPKVYRFWKTPALQRLLTDCRPLLSRLPIRSAVLQEIKRYYASGHYILRGIYAFYIVAALLLFAAIYEGYSMWRFNTAKIIAVNPSTTKGQLTDLRAYFEGFGQRIRVLPLTVGSNEARVAIDELDKRIEDLWWNEIDSKGVREEKVKICRQYLEERPQGRYVSQCQGVIDEYESWKINEKIEDWITIVQQSFDTCNDETCLKEIYTKALNGPPHFVEDENHRKRIRELREKVTSKLAIDLAKKDWLKFIASYEDSLLQKDVVIAAKLLAKRTTRDEKWQEVVHAFPARAREIVQREVDDALKTNDFPESNTILENCRNAFRELETSFSGSDISGLDFPAEIRSLDALQLRIDSQWDRHLYGVVQRLQSKQACQEYSDRAPVKVMKEDVEKFFTYLNQIEGKLNVQVELRILWDKDHKSAAGPDNVVSVLVDGAQRGRSAGRVEPTTGGIVSGPVLSFDIDDVELSDSFQLKVRIVEEDTYALAGQDDVFEGVKTATIRDLSTGIAIALKPVDWENGPKDSEARLKVIAGIPQQPELPPWKDL